MKCRYCGREIICNNADPGPEWYVPGGYTDSHGYEWSYSCDAKGNENHQPEPKEDLFDQLYTKML